MKRRGMGVLALLGALGLVGCEDGLGGYSDNVGYRLSFSVDTLSFDTVFSSVGSATRQLMVYNRNKEALNISLVCLASGGESGFRVNIDGRSGGTFRDVLIGARDSLYAFVEVTVDPLGRDSALWVEDALMFTVNGVEQGVCLRACGQDVHLLRGETEVLVDTLWAADRPYLIYDSVRIVAGATLRIGAGAVLYMHDGARWLVEGTLRTEGREGLPVTFRGDRMDELLADVPYDRIPNQWDGLYYGSESFDNVMEHTVVRNGRGGLSFASSEAGRVKMSMRSCQLVNMEGSVLSAENCWIEAVNTEFGNGGDGVLSLTGGVGRFVHCTVVDYFIFSPGRSGNPAVRLSNYRGGEESGEEALPLEARFENCIIDGSMGDEVGVDSMAGVAMDLLFNHCALRTAEKADERYVGVQFIRSDFAPQYRSIGNEENHYVFDYRLDIRKEANGEPAAVQVAIGQADREVAATEPLDRLGVNRLSDADGPDMGAYEYVPDAEEETP